MPFRCAACPREASDELQTGAAFPVGWFNCHLNEYGELTPGRGRVYLLCADCGNDAQFRGGMSPELRKRFADQGVTFRER